jgi:hypothetical protein
MQWRWIDTPREPLKLFVHLAGPDLKPVRQVDKALGPSEGLALDDKKERVLDVVDLVLDEHVPAGRYTLVMGVYSEESGRRLNPHLGGRDYLELQDIAITK